jgi:2-polyprenyl-3-methyl-5-hydroxy-6-metoxy-1,4-benzoquinol methylase
MKNDTWIERNIGTPDKIPGDWVVNNYKFNEISISLIQPKNPDKLLDDPNVHAASAKNDYMPYWGYLWPSALMLSSDVLKRDWEPGTRTLEIGCGLGLTGIAALYKGLEVTFSDYTEAALSIATYNAKLNGFDNFETSTIDWKNPPSKTFDVILGADVLYENRCREDILRVLDHMLSKNGVSLISDSCRPSADSFARCAIERDYVVRECPATSIHTSAKGRIFELRKK